MFLSAEFFFSFSVSGKVFFGSLGVKTFVSYSTCQIFLLHVNDVVHCLSILTLKLISEITAKFRFFRS